MSVDQACADPNRGLHKAQLIRDYLVSVDQACADPNRATGKW
ncbi:protein of unknown function [Methylacidimicrobium sp. AP8]|nr:protein of unknown function [Methylacidimicrobium sp. AP8]